MTPNFPNSTFNEELLKDCSSNFSQNDNSILKVSECSEESLGKCMKESLTEKEQSIKQNVTN